MIHGTYLVTLGGELPPPCEASEKTGVTVTRKLLKNSAISVTLENTIPTV
jgi:hypothetical protein